MISIRKSEDRGAADHGWLKAKHSFSFASYYDPAHMGFAPLRVINEDRIAGGGGFATHPHENMEIITYVLEGALEHKDSMGNHGVINAGEVQHMSAGTGVRHSEFNGSASDETHLFQIWIEPDEKDVVPHYDQKNFEAPAKRNQLRLIVSKTGRDGSIAIHQDTDVYASLLDRGGVLTHGFADGRRGWLQMARGAVAVNGVILGVGDGAQIEGEVEIELAAQEDAEFLLFDLG